MSADKKAISNTVVKKSCTKHMDTIKTITTVLLASVKARRAHLKITFCSSWMLLALIYKDLSHVQVTYKRSCKDFIFKYLNIVQPLYTKENNSQTEQQFILRQSLLVSPFRLLLLLLSPGPRQLFSPVGRISVLAARSPGLAKTVLQATVPGRRRRGRQRKR